MIRFINRKSELSLLHKEISRQGAAFIVLYGRRRIGKTALITEYIKDKTNVFYIAEDTNKKIQIHDFQQHLARFFKDELLETMTFDEWKDLFMYLKRVLPTDKKIIIAIDEFSYLLKNDAVLASSLQKFWDTFLSKTECALLVSGSLFGMMSEQVLSSSSPLYGRRTRDLLLRVFSFTDARMFLSMSFVDALQTYLCVGGVPEYLLRAKEYNKFSSFFSQEVTNRDGYFYREPYFLLSQEFKEIKTYFSLVNAVAYGNTKASEIANYAGIRTREIYPYLENLLRLDVIEKITPLMGGSKQGVYIIYDTFFDCWFNFVHKNREAIERGQYSIDKKELHTYLGKRFEITVRTQFLPLLFPRFSFGKWWHKEDDIDCIGVNDEKKKALFFECKWKHLKKNDTQQLLDNIKEKTSLFLWKNDERKEQIGIIAKKIDDKDLFRKQGYLVYDLSDWERVVTKENE